MGTCGGGLLDEGIGAWQTAAAQDPTPADSAESAVAAEGPPTPTRCNGGRCDIDRGRLSRLVLAAGTELPACRAQLGECWATMPRLPAERECPVAGCPPRWRLGLICGGSGVAAGVAVGLLLALAAGGG